MRTSAKHPCRLIAAALAALQLCAGAAGAVFDNSFSYTYSLGSGLQYSRTEGKNSAGLQRANVLTYSPNTGVTPIMVYADEQLYGSKATITNAVKYLQNQGKTVLGGTNADFFVMSTGIPIGLVIDSGELISSDAWQYAVGFKKDGTAVLGRPTMGIRVSGKSGTVNVSYFNKTRVRRLARTCSITTTMTRRTLQPRARALFSSAWMIHRSRSTARSSSRS